MDDNAGTKPRIEDHFFIIPNVQYLLAVRG